VSRRRVIGALLVPLLAASLLVAWASRRELGRPDEWLRVERAPFESRVKASGEIHSGNSLTVGCPSVDYMWEYTITSIAEEGTAVEPGATLLQFDGRKLQERLEVRTSELQTARKELAKSRLDLEDKKGALELELIELKAKRQRLDRELDLPIELRGRLELERTRIDADLARREIELTTARLEAQRQTGRLRLDAAERKVARLEESIARIRDGLQRLRVTAPRQGYVVLIADWNGEKPRVGESVWQGRPLIELADLSKMEVAAAVAEPDAGLVRVGQRVEVRLDAAPERLFTGEIRRLGRLFRTRSAEDPEKVFDALVTDRRAPTPS